jgi:membrane protein YdbS with pleckstrin-like domain
MSTEKTGVATGGTTAASWPLASILTIVFVVLKLTDVIDWSWVWVLSPLWIGAAFTIFLLFLMLLGVVVYYLVKK